MPARKTTAVPKDPAAENTVDQTPVEAPESGATAAVTTAVGDAYAQALLRERADYVRHGLSGRATAVDAELKRIGVTPPKDT